jgi:pantoate--beta-alanine ligase
VQVVRRMVADLDWPITIVPVPTVREADGLALSSRNRFLSAADRVLAPVFYRVLLEVADGLRRGRPGAIADGESALRAAGLAPEYLALVDGASMQVVESADDASRLVGLVRLGSVRLLDNVAVFG